MFLLLLFAVSLHPSQGSMDEYLISRNISSENWTTCEQFLSGTSFDLTSVLDVDWVIFYYWSAHSEQSYHIRFSEPSKILVDRFRLELNDDIQPRVNWSHADLFVETSIDLSGLFIRTNQSGRFRFIPSFSFQFHYAPWLQFALKVVDGFLGMMNCRQKVAYALAPVQNMPSPLEINKTAAIFGIQNPLGRSYLTKDVYDPPATALEMPDPDEDAPPDDLERSPISADTIF